MLRYLPLLLLPAVATADSKPPVPFAAKLYGQLAKGSGNLFFSPASISTALAMAREGARGATADEMDKVLGPDARTDAKALVKSFKTPKREADGNTPPELSIANRLFADGATQFEQLFLDLTGKDYLAPAQVLDFRHKWEDARATINKWVADQTHDKIKDLLAKGTVDDTTRMVLVNAIYLKAQWATPFPEAATKPAPFAITGAGSKQVPTMHTVAGATWGAHAGARMLDLPYYSAGGPQLGMLLVVPDGKDLGAVEGAFAKEGLQPFLAATKTNYGKADVALPKFEIGTTFELSDALKALGMTRAFSDEFADFTGISKLRTKISKVVHKAWAKVDEKGTEAAAATAVVMVEATSVNIDVPHPFKVDRSFLFFIHDDKGNILFGGRIADPTQK